MTILPAMIINGKLYSQVNRDGDDIGTSFLRHGTRECVQCSMHTKELDESGLDYPKDNYASLEKTMHGKVCKVPVVKVDLPDL